MFEFIRTHQRLMQLFLMLIIAPFFIAGGLQVGKFGESDTAVAKVGDKIISQQQLEYALRELDPQAASAPGAKQEVLDKLITERVLGLEAKHDRSSPTAADIQLFVLKNFPELADPSLSQEERAKRYQAIAGSKGMSIAMLEDRIARQLVYERTAGEIQSSVFVPKSVVGRLSDLVEQEREVQQMLFKTADFTSQVKVTDDMLKEYYHKNLAQFQVPEQAKIEYVVLSADILAPKMAVSDADANAYYEQNKKLYGIEEQRRASHILIKVAKGATDVVKADAKAKAEKLLAEARKAPGEFAKLAKENSQDEGSAERGGDLDFFSHGMMAKPFQDAVDKLKVGEISDIVQSDYGYHIIKLTAVKPAVVKAFDDVKADILTELRKQQAAKKYSELRETFTNTVYEQADSLKPVVDKLSDKAGLKIETVAGLARSPDPAVAPTVAYNNQKFLTLLFSDDSIKSKHNTEAVEVSPGTLISGRVVEYKTASQRPFEEVQATVREAVIKIEARKLAQKACEAKLAELKIKDDPTGFTAPQTVSRTRMAGFPSVAQALMKADVSKLPSFVEVESPMQGYSVYRINKIGQPATPDPANRTAIQQQLGNVLAQQEMHAYIEALKHNAKVKVLRPDAVADAASAAQGKNTGDTGTEEPY
ncbi:MAG: peptidylprolyl isomerase [Burkholderiales bacterium]